MLELMIWLLHVLRAYIEQLLDVLLRSMSSLDATVPLRIHSSVTYHTTS